MNASQPCRFFATTPRNMEDLLADELRALAVSEVAPGRGGVGFEGPLRDGYLACLWSRIASRVLLQLGECTADSSEALYSGVQTIDWSRHLSADGTFAVSLTAARSRLGNTHFGALKVKDAIVDQFRARTGRRPSIDTDRPDLRVNVHVWRDKATISIDLSGGSLHRRGYRERGVAAPLKENLAAAMLVRAGWPGVAAADGCLVDPMCGSGTLPIEAALMAADVAPGLLRTYWGFDAWLGHDAPAWRELMSEARERRRRGLENLPSIRGYDVDPAAVRVAIGNVERAGLAGCVHIERADLSDCGPARDTDTGLLIANPPYGERLGDPRQLDGLYARLGSVLRDRFAGWRAAVMTGNPSLGLALGMRARRVHTLYNGALECRLLHFDLAPGAVRATGGAPKPLPPDQRSDGAVMFANRLRKNQKKLRRWREREQIHCYRLYDRDLPEYAVVVDVYEGDRCRAHVQEYQAPRSVDAGVARLRLREALGVVAEVLDLAEDDLYVKRRRRQRGSAQYDKIAESGQFHEVQEGGCRFLVNLGDYLDTGLFLDHRLTRKRVAELAGGRRFLNLFAYTGAATVHAAKAGAIATTTVDMSRTYLDWARRNFRLNGLDESRHHLVQADCMTWLETAANAEPYDVIFLDPPSFSTSKRMKGTLDIQRDHVALILKTLNRLAPDGVLVFSCNRRGFKLDAAALSDLVVEDISRSTIPRDFERHPGVHTCLLIRRGNPRRSTSRTTAQ